MILNVISNIQFVQPCGPGKYDMLLCPTPVINVSASQESEDYSDYDSREDVDSISIEGDVNISIACNKKT